MGRESHGEKEGGDGGAAADLRTSLYSIHKRLLEESNRMKCPSRTHKLYAQSFNSEEKRLEGWSNNQGGNCKAKAMGPRATLASWCRLHSGCLVNQTGPFPRDAPDAQQTAELLYVVSFSLLPTEQRRAKKSNIGMLWKNFNNVNVLAQGS